MCLYKDFTDFFAFRTALSLNVQKRRQNGRNATVFVLYSSCFLPNGKFAHFASQTRKIVPLRRISTAEKRLCFYPTIFHFSPYFNAFSLIRRALFSFLPIVSRMAIFYRNNLFSPFIILRFFLFSSVKNDAVPCCATHKKTPILVR